MNLKRNMGLIDQVFRTCMGLSLIYIGPFSDVITSDAMSAILLSVVGVMIIVSSLIGWCPVYHMAGFNTNKSEKSE